MAQVEFENDIVQMDSEGEEELSVINLRRTRRRVALDEEEEGEEAEEAEEVTAEAETPKRKKRRTTQPSLPPCPEFEPFVHTKPLHNGYARLPRILDVENLTPFSIFSFFFNDCMFNTLVENTNAYAKAHFAGNVERPWIETNYNEIKVWIALLIYQGLHKEASVADHWNLSPMGPISKITRLMTLTRFEQIKRFFHISPPSQVKGKHYETIEPLMSHIRDTSKKLYVPSSKVSIDEMMVQFSGRSIHTVKIKGKPTPEGYKIMSLCDAGYTYTFIPTSCVERYDVENIPGVNYTGCIVNHLVQQLPVQTLAFNVYCELDKLLWIGFKIRIK